MSSLSLLINWMRPYWIKVFISSNKILLTSNFWMVVYVYWKTCQKYCWRKWFLWSVKYRLICICAVRWAFSLFRETGLLWLIFTKSAEGVSLTWNRYIRPGLLFSPGRHKYSDISVSSVKEVINRQLNPTAGKHFLVPMTEREQEKQ